MAEVDVIISAVHDEAKKWKGLSDLVVPIKSAVDGLDLSVLAFFIGDPFSVVVHHKAYNNFQSYMSKALDGAVTEFEQLGMALDKITDAYERADQIVSVNLSKIYRA